MEINYFIYMMFVFILGISGTVSAINNRVKKIEKLLEDKENK